MADKNTTPSLSDLLGEASAAPENSSTGGGESPSSPAEAMGLEDLLSDSETKKSASNEELSLDDLLAGSDKKDEKKEVVNFSDLSSSSYTSSGDSTEGNIFQKTFNDSGVGEDGSIIDAIENDGKQKLHLDTQEEDGREESPFELMKRKEEESFYAERKKWRVIVVLSQSVGVLFIVLGIAAFLIFSVLMDTEDNGLLGGVVSENYGTQRDEKEEALNDINSEIKGFKKDIESNKKIIEGLENNTVLSSIISDRVNWLQAIDRIMEVRRDAHPAEGSQSIFFENYSTKGVGAGNVQIMISGRAYSSQGVFQKIATLVDTFNESEYFEGAKMSRFNKSTDGRQYYMPFSFQLKYFQDGKFSKKKIDEEDTPKK